MIRLFQALHARFLHWLMVGSVAEIDRLHAWRREVERRPPTPDNLELIEDIGYLIAAEQWSIARAERRLSAVMAGAL